MVQEASCLNPVVACNQGFTIELGLLPAVCLCIGYFPLWKNTPTLEQKVQELNNTQHS